MSISALLSSSSLGSGIWQVPVCCLGAVKVAVRTYAAALLLSNSCSEKPDYFFSLVVLQCTVVETLPSLPAVSCCLWWSQSVSPSAVSGGQASPAQQRQCPTGAMGSAGAAVPWSRGGWLGGSKVNTGWPISQPVNSHVALLGKPWSSRVWGRDMLHETRSPERIQRRPREIRPSSAVLTASCCCCLSPAVTGTALCLAKIKNCARGGFKKWNPFV